MTIETIPASAVRELAERISAEKCWDEEIDMRDRHAEWLFDLLAPAAPAQEGMEDAGVHGTSPDAILMQRHVLGPLLAPRAGRFRVYLEPVEKPDG